MDHKYGLPEIAEKIAKVFGRDFEATHNSIRKMRDRGMLSHSFFEGRKAIFDESELVKATILFSLLNHGFEGLALQNIGKQLDRHDAPIQPDTIEPKGFSRVVSGISVGEDWDFCFWAVDLKRYNGSCRYNRERSEHLDVTRPVVETAVDLISICKSLGVVGDRA